MHKILTFKKPPPIFTIRNIKILMIFFSLINYFRFIYFICYICGPNISNLPLSPIHSSKYCFEASMMGILFFFYLFLLVMTLLSASKIQTQLCFSLNNNI